jgi:hypothetical protein
VSCIDCYTPGRPEGGGELGEGGGVDRSEGKPFKLYSALAQTPYDRHCHNCSINHVMTSNPANVHRVISNEYAIQIHATLK